MCDHIGCKPWGLHSDSSFLYDFKFYAKVKNIDRPYVHFIYHEGFIYNQLHHLLIIMYDFERYMDIIFIAYNIFKFIFT